MTKIVEIGEGKFGTSVTKRLETGDGSTNDGTVEESATIKEVKFDLGRPVEKDKAGIGKRRPTPIITYEAFMWFMFITTTGLAIVDRFVWNVWPRQTFSIGAGSAGSDRLVGFKPGPWSVVLYDILARISGRYAILCYNFLLITRLKSLEYWLMNDSFVARYLLDCTNVVEANNRLHNYNGIGLCVLTLLHIWSILFPCITHGYTAKMIPGVWEWPASERTPVKCSVEDVPGCWPGDANNELKQMGLQADDVFRLVEMTLFLMILMSLSVKWLATRWHAAIQLHRLINIVYFVDIVRRHSHPHSWILPPSLSFTALMHLFGALSGAVTFSLR